MDNVDCSGNEDLLSQCNHTEVGAYYCSTKSGVKCNCMFCSLTLAENVVIFFSQH